MELRHLRYFAALTQALNFTRAAQMVHVTQSTLSHQIAQLEQELGTRLFVRDPGGLQLTPEGEAFLVQAKRALDAIDEGVRSMHASPPLERRPIRIGSTPSLSSSFVAPVLAQLMRRRPATSLTLLDMFPAEIGSGLATGQLDLGVAYPPMDVQGLTGEKLFSEDLKVVVGPDHALARRRRVQLADLHGRALILPTERFSIRHMVDDFLLAAGAEPVVVAEVDSLQATLTLLRELDAAALMPETAVPQAPWRVIPVERPFASRVVTLYRRAGEPLRPEVKLFHKALRDAARAAAPR